MADIKIRSTTYRRTASTAYYLGRKAATWQRALRHHRSGRRPEGWGAGAP